MLLSLLTKSQLQVTTEFRKRGASPFHIFQHFSLLCLGPTSPPSPNGTEVETTHARMLLRAPAASISESLVAAHITPGAGGTGLPRAVDGSCWQNKAKTFTTCCDNPMEPHTL